jgi:hypothetical protein
MNRKLEISWCFILLIAVLFGCQSASIEPRFVRDIPNHKYEAQTLLQGVRATKDSLGLDDLENGYDSLQIRMWFTYPMSDSEQVLSIKRNNGHWYGNFCLASYRLTLAGDSISRYTIHFFKPILRSDWSEIVDTLVKFNIMAMRDEQEVIGLDTINSKSNRGCGSVIVEIASRYKYKLFFYSAPVNFKEQFKEAADVCQIAEFLSNRLGIKYLGAF